MTKQDKKRKILNRAQNCPQSLTLHELEWLAQEYGFVFDREHGSHRLYYHVEDPSKIMNFQPREGDSKMAKPYQVKQLVAFIMNKQQENE